MLFLLAVLLSLGAVDALIPLLIVLILIAAAAGANRGFSLFNLFGIATLIGLGNPGGKGSIQGKTALPLPFYYTTFQQKSGTSVGNVVVGKFNKRYKSWRKGRIVARQAVKGTKAAGGPRQRTAKEFETKKGFRGFVNRVRVGFGRVGAAKNRVSNWSNLTRAGRAAKRVAKLGLGVTSILVFPAGIIAYGMYKFSKFGLQMKRSKDEKGRPVYAPTTMHEELFGKKKPGQGVPKTPLRQTGRALLMFVAPPAFVAVSIWRMWVNHKSFKEDTINEYREGKVPVKAQRAIDAYKRGEIDKATLKAEVKAGYKEEYKAGARRTFAGAAARGAWNVGTDALTGFSGFRERYRTGKDKETLKREENMGRKAAERRAEAAADVDELGNPLVFATDSKRRARDVVADVRSGLWEGLNLGRIGEDWKTGEYVGIGGTERVAGRASPFARATWGTAKTVGRVFWNNDENWGATGAINGTWAAWKGAAARARSEERSPTGAVIGTLLNPTGHFLGDIGANVGFYRRPKRVGETTTLEKDTLPPMPEKSNDPNLDEKTKDAIFKKDMGDWVRGLRQQDTEALIRAQHAVEQEERVARSRMGFGGAKEAYRLRMAGNVKEANGRELLASAVNAREYARRELEDMAENNQNRKDFLESVLNSRDQLSLDAVVKVLSSSPHSNDREKLLIRRNNIKTENLDIDTMNTMLRDSPFGREVLSRESFGKAVIEQQQDEIRHIQNLENEKIAIRMARVRDKLGREPATSVAGPEGEPKPTTFRRERTSAGGDETADYGILGLEPGASLDEVERAFRRRARETHPDTAGAAADTAEFTKLVDAHERLQRKLREEVEGAAS